MSNATIPATPSALVVHNKTSKGKGTLVVIRLGNIKVAGGVIGGTFTEQQALAEFKKGHKNIKVATGMEEFAEITRKMIV